MSLYLVQHGKSLSREINPDRPLSDEGREVVAHIARVAAGYRVPVSVIRHSGKTRARQTADILASFLKPAQGVCRSDGLDPNDDVTAVESIIAGQENVMLVGHLPYMERLVSYLTTGSVLHTVFRFQHGGIVCLDRDEETDGWYIRWALSPEIG